MICECPKVDLEKWDMREFRFRKKFFLHSKARLFFHKPMFLYNCMSKLYENAKIQGYEKGDFLLQKDGTFGGELLLDIKNPNESDSNLVVVENAHGFSKVHIGSLDDIPTSLDFLKDFVMKRGYETKGIYFWYLDCPSCIEDEKLRKTIIFAFV